MSLALLIDSQTTESPRTGNHHSNTDQSQFFQQLQQELTTIRCRGGRIEYLIINDQRDQAIISYRLNSNHIQSTITSQER